MKHCSSARTPMASGCHADSVLNNCPLLSSLTPALPVFLPLWAHTQSCVPPLCTLAGTVEGSLVGCGATCWLCSSLHPPLPQLPLTHPPLFTCEAKNCFDQALGLFPEGQMHSLEESKESKDSAFSCFLQPLSLPHHKRMAFISGLRSSFPSLNFPWIFRVKG